MEITRGTDGRLVCPFDHNAPEFAQTFIEATEQLQRDAPFVWSDTNGGFWLASTFDLVRRLGTDESLLIVGENGIQVPSHPPGQLKFVPGEADGEAHDNYRLALNPMFTKEVADGLRPGIDARVERLLDALLPRGEFDVINEYVKPVVNGVACEHLGLDVENPVRFNIAILHGFRHAANASFPTPHIKDEWEWAWGVIVETVAARRACPRQDVISHLVQWTSPAFTDDELYRMTMNVILGAADTTAELTSRAILYLDQHPELGQQLAANPEMIEGSIDEFLRLLTPVMHIGRTAATDFEFEGTTIRSGERVLMSFWGANHDPRKYPDPYTFDLTRNARQHVAMSVGTHFCLGVWIAKHVAAASIRGLLNRAPNYRVLVDRADINQDLPGLGRWRTMPASVATQAAD